MLAVADETRRDVLLGKHRRPEFCVNKFVFLECADFRFVGLRLATKRHKSYQSLENHFVLFVAYNLFIGPLLRCFPALRFVRSVFRAPSPHLTPLSVGLESSQLLLLRRWHAA